MKQTIELNYKGRTEEVTIISTDGAAVMSPTRATKQEMMWGKVRCVSYDPINKVVVYKGAGDKVLKEYDQRKDPEQFIIDWSLHNTALVKDQEVDGAILSDWTYFNNQVIALHKSCVWGLINVLGLRHNQAIKYADKGVRIMKQEILISRGVDLNAPISKEDKENDEAISMKESTRNFYNLTHQHETF